jgi:hypothetical protein
LLLTDDGGTVIVPTHNPTSGCWVRLYSGPLDVRWFGARGDGIANDRTSVLAAINAGAANGGAIEVVFPFGKYSISGDPLAIPSSATQLILRCAEEVTFDSTGSHIWCNGVNGALLGFDFSLPNLPPISIIGLDFDGSNGGSALSTTWTGLFPASEIEAPDIRVSGCAIHSTSVVGARAIDLTNLVFGLVENCHISQFINGYAIYLAGANELATTATLRKLYLNYNLECLYVGGSVSDCHIYDTVFESSLVAVAVYDSQISLNGCYFENIGYTEGQNTALTLQNMGIDDAVTPPDDVPVNTAMHFRYGCVVFRSCLFQYLCSNSLAVAWVRGVGMGSQLGAYGSATFEACRRQITGDVFIAPSLENSGGYAFIVFDPFAISDDAGVIQTYADARLVNHGRINLLFASPNDFIPVKVENRLFVYGQEPDNAYTAPLAAAPTGGSNLVGDRVINSAPAAGGCMGWVCIAAGNPGIWKTYAPIGT